MIFAIRSNASAPATGLRAFIYNITRESLTLGIPRHNLRDTYLGRTAEICSLFDWTSPSSGRNDFP